MAEVRMRAEQVTPHGLALLERLGFGVTVDERAPLRRIANHGRHGYVVAVDGWVERWDASRKAEVTAEKWLAEMRRRRDQNNYDVSVIVSRDRSHMVGIGCHRTHIRNITAALQVLRG